MECEEGSSESIILLFKHLCNLYFEQCRTTYLHKSKCAEEKLKKHLQRKAYDALFGYLTSERKKKDVKLIGLNKQIERLLSWILVLNQQRKTETASRLEQQLELITEKEKHEGCKIDVEAVLRFLLCLTDSGQQEKDVCLGYPKRLPDVWKQETRTAFPLVSPEYRLSTQAVSTKEASFAYYSHYPRSLFEKSGLDCTENWQKIFTLTPGNGLSENGMFNVQGCLQDEHEMISRLSLFGALVCTQVKSLDIKLDFPELENRNNPSSKDLMLPRQLVSPLSSPDEGFSEAVTPPSTPVIFTDSGIEIDIWEQALDFVPRKHYTWETVGRCHGIKEHPYLAEAGTRAVDECFNRRLREITLLCPDVVVPPRRIIFQEQLISNIAYLLIGVPSQTFYLDEDKRFCLTEGTYMSGCTPESLWNMLEDFMEYGTIYNRLTLFSQVGSGCSEFLMNDGLILQAFRRALGSVLQHYRASVLSISTNATLLQLCFKCHKLFAQMRFLGNLCHCGDRQEDGTNASFPRGLSLLSYLYQEALENCDTDHYLLMLFLLQMACKPYTLFLQDWIFCGVCHDDYSEFMFEVKNKYLYLRNQCYWTMGFQLRSQLTQDDVPGFLDHMIGKILVCGKSINLLRLCCPQHFICNVHACEVPQVEFVYSEKEMKSIQIQCQVYFSQMEQTLRQMTQFRHEKQQMLVREKQDLMQKARQTAVKELQRIETNILNRKKLEDSKKRKEFHRLKEQMQLDLKRRSKKKDREEEEDREFMAKLMKHEQELAIEEEELEKKAREDLVTFYAELSEQAAARERKALWRIQRGKLDQVRMDFMLQDENKWKQEMEAWKISHDQYQDFSLVVQAADVEKACSLPVAEIEDENLPQWAQKKVGKFPVGLQDIVEDLPSWARRKDVLAGVVENEINKYHDVPVLMDIDQSKTLLEAEISFSQSNAKELNLIDFEETSVINPVIPSLKHKESMHAGEEPAPVEMYHNFLKQSDSMHAKAESTPAEDEHELTKLKRNNSMHATKESAPTEDEHSIPKLKQSDSMHATKESAPKEDQHGIPKLKQSNSMHATKESAHAEDEHSIPKLKQSDSMHATKESAPAEDVHGIPKLKQSDSMHATKESAPAEDDHGIPKLKQSNNMHATKESAHAEDEHSIPKLKQSDSMHATKESAPAEDVHGIPKLKQSDSMHATKESAPAEDVHGIPKLKQSDSMHATKESAPAEDDHGIPKLKQSNNMHATKESAPAEDEHRIPKLKQSNSMHATKESAPSQDEHGIPKLKLTEGMSANKESEPEIRKIQKQSFYGNVSQLTRSDYILDLPKIKELAELNKILEPNLKDITICRPWKRCNAASSVGQSSEETGSAVHATKECENDVIMRPHIKMNEAMSATTESQAINWDVVRMKKFKKQNLHGHSSDSTIQRLLYGDHFGASTKMSKVDKIAEETETREPVVKWREVRVDPYEQNFDSLDAEPDLNLLMRSVYGEEDRESLFRVQDITELQYMPLSTILNRSIVAPLSAQIDLVNKCIVNYIFMDLALDEHFSALRRYLLMEDGDFAEILSEKLFNWLSTYISTDQPIDYLFWNSALSCTVKSSIHAEDKYANNLSFALPSLPVTNVSDLLNLMDLRYKVDWPLNVIITEQCSQKYSRLFSFMLRLKRIVWVLNDIWCQLKRASLINRIQKTSQGVQLTKLHLYGHAMEHFVKGLQGYIVNQIIHVTWQEFQDDLNQNIHNLDDLCRAHNRYLERALFRCLLTKKCEPTMKIIENLFSLITKFRMRLESEQWTRNKESDKLVHPNFKTMECLYDSFRCYSQFLFKVLGKLVASSYQPHLEELVLRLNFNNFYKT